MEERRFESFWNGPTSKCVRRAVAFAVEAVMGLRYASINFANEQHRSLRP
jgi:hypothetical protein